MGLACSTAWALYGTYVQDAIVVVRHILYLPFLLPPISYLLPHTSYLLPPTSYLLPPTSLVLLRVGDRREEKGERRKGKGVWWDHLGLVMEKEDGSI